MANIKKLLESIDSMSKAVQKPTGPKFPGYWKGKDSAAKSRSRMVGAQESLVKELHDKTNSFEYKLQEAFTDFKKQYGAIDPQISSMPQSNVNKQISGMAQNAAKDSGVAPAKSTPPAYTGIDPIVRQRMGMQPATQDEIRTYLDKNPPFVTSSDGQPIRSGSGAPVVSGGQTAVGRAADAVSPDRERAEAMPRPQQITVLRKPTISLPPDATTSPVTSTNVQATDLPPAPSAVAPAAATTKPVAQKPTVPTMPAKVQPGSWQDLWKNNPQLKNPNLIRPGQSIKLPDGTTAVVDKGDTLSSIAKRYRQGGYREGTPVNEGEPGDLEHELNRREYHNDKIAGRYDPDEFDQMVLRLKKLAQKQERERGAVDIAKLSKRLKDLDRKEVKEYDNAQDPNAQVTSPSDPKPSTASQQSQQQANMKDQAVDMATAKSTTATLKNVLGPKFDPSQAATAIVKANDGKPMSSQEQQAMSSITPLVMKAAETPSASGQLKSALQNAGLMAKQGK